jgi:glycosidase
MRIIIDGVFNHTGTRFWAFLDLKKEGINSKYKDWYIVNSFDDTSTPENEFDYKGWWGVKSLPELNRREFDLIPGPKQYIFNSTKKWMDPNGDGYPSDGIDGWRLDVAREVPLGFWKDWSRLVKSLNPHAIIIGELWELSPDFVSEEGPFDALMNYNFAFAVNDFFIAQKNRISVTEFVEKLMEVKRTYPAENLHLLQNLMASHDTDRLSSMIKNPDRKYDRDANEGNSNYDPGKPDSDNYTIQKMILGFQMTYQGAPMIYYGNEVGMWGADDPHCRRPMIWNELQYDNEVIDKHSGFNIGFGEYAVFQMEDLLSFYKKMISIRNKNVALKRGTVEFIYSDNDKKTISFLTSYDDEVCLVAFNLGDESVAFDTSVPFSMATYVELISGGSGMISSETSSAPIEVVIPSRSFRIYKFSNAE